MWSSPCAAILARENLCSELSSARISFTASFKRLSSAPLLIASAFCDACASLSASCRWLTRFRTVPTAFISSWCRLGAVAACRMAVCAEGGGTRK